MISYRGYKINTERINGRWQATVLPITPDLPILREYLFDLSGSQPEALVEIRSRIDRLLKC